MTDEARYSREEEFSDRAIGRYLDAGATMVVIPYAKCFGLEATPEEIAEGKDFIARARARGLRTSVYLRVDALAPETVAAAHPEVHEWLALGMHERKSYYGAQQTFRQRVCYFHPGAMAWLEGVLRHAVEEMKADMIHCDGFSPAGHLPWQTSRSPRALAAYRAWLKRRYADPAEREAFFGVVDFDRIEFPEYAEGPRLPAMLRSADFQAWYRFLWDKELAFTRHVRRHVKSLDPEVALYANPWWSRAVPVPRVACSHVERLLPWLDAVFSEDPYHLQFTGGRVRSRLGMFKTAREYDIPVLHYHWVAKPRAVQSSLALSVAANGGHAAALGFGLRYMPHYSIEGETKRKVVSWVQDHWPLLGRNRPLGDLALVRHHESMAWNAREPWWAPMGFEQLLTAMKVPWRLFDRLEAAPMAQVRTLVLPEAESLSDEELVLLRGWVENGGNLLVTGRTATHDGSRRRRPANGILSWLPDYRVPGPTEWLRWAIEDGCEVDYEFEEENGERSPRIVKVGRGRLGIWPELQWPQSLRDLGGECYGLQCIRPRDLTPPLEEQQLAAFVRELHGEFPVEVEGPASLLVEYSQQPKTGEWLIHLIDCGATAQTAPVTLRRRGGWSGVRLLTPDDTPVTHIVEGDNLRLRGLPVYTVVAVRNAAPVRAS